jgi:membrane protein DedA with SNARE-associated domain/rhodanese-related sulfurtransferase
MEPMALLAQWGLVLVFASVLLEQAGLPVPAPPILIGAGALAVEGAMHPAAVLAAGLLACLIADHAWFIAGRRHGRRLLAGLCRISLSPDTCVRKADDLIGRHGAALLLVAKFVPGVSAVSIPTVAAVGVPYGRFLAFDAGGALIWTGSYVALGMIFHREVQRVLELLFGGIGRGSLAVLAVLFALYIAFKLARRHQLRRLFKVRRIDPDEMVALMASEPDLVIVDARSRVARDADPRRFPNAVEYQDEEFAAVLPAPAGGRTIVTFCTCPNEASAALLAERLIKAGYDRVRVLAGGEDALARLAR